MLHVKIVSPNQVVFDGDAQSVLLPGADGEMEVLTQHADYAALLQEGLIRVSPDSGSAQQFSLMGTGLASISNDQVTVFVDAVETVSLQ